MPDPPTVLVTGGAARIGAAIARVLAAQGWRVAVHARRIEAARVFAATLPDAIGVGGDLSDPTTPAALISAVRLAFKTPVCGLVNNASLFAYDRAPLCDGALLDAHLAVNLTAPVLLASALASQHDLADGAVVNMLDQKLANLNPDFFSYSCSKVALAGATTMLGQQLGPRLRINAVSPGITLPSLDQSAAHFGAVASRNLLCRPIEIDAIADAVAYLLHARGVHRQTIFVDNGQHLVPSMRDVMFDRPGDDD